MFGILVKHGNFHPQSPSLSIDYLTLELRPFARSFPFSLPSKPKNRCILTQLTDAAKGRRSAGSITCFIDEGGAILAPKQGSKGFNRLGRLVDELFDSVSIRLDSSFLKLSGGYALN